MSTYYYILLIIFFVIASMMVIDNNVATYFILLTKIAKVNYERTIWMIRFHPFWSTNVISKWWKMKQYERTVRELAQEFSKDPDSMV